MPLAARANLLAGVACTEQRSNAWREFSWE